MKSAILYLDDEHHGNSLQNRSYLLADDDDPHGNRFFQDTLGNLSPAR